MSTHQAVEEVVSIRTSLGLAGLGAYDERGGPPPDEEEDIEAGQAEEAAKVAGCPPSHELLLEVLHSWS